MCAALFEIRTENALSLKIKARISVIFFRRSLRGSESAFNDDVKKCPYRLTEPGGNFFRIEAGFLDLIPSMGACITRADVIF